MTADADRNLLARMAQRAEDDPFFIAGALAVYRALRGIDDAALAAELGCDAAALVRLALCRRPEGESPMFRAEVERIAAYAGCDAGRLAAALRAADVAERMRAAAPGGLLAARDRPPVEPDPPAGPDPEPPREEPPS